MRVFGNQRATNAMLAFNTTEKDHLVLAGQEAGLVDIKD
jgi:hypothetical protein